MPRFFVDHGQIAENSVTIQGADAHHIARSLRMAVGQHITVCDSLTSIQYDCVLEQFDDDNAVVARIVKQEKLTTEPPFEATLYQALPKGDKLDSIIQKAVECGVAHVVPIESERCVVKVKKDAEEHKTARRCRIAEEAAKQCGRGVIPTVAPTQSFKSAISQATQADIVLFCYEGEGTVPLKQLIQQQTAGFADKRPTVSIIVGSEGGFSNAEVDLAKAAGCQPVGLGKRILRAETAPSFVLACLVYELEL